MPVIAVINRKGGSGKSTLATHLAGFLSGAGQRVMLGDTDKQQSTQAWLRVRATQALPKSQPIVGWALDPKSVMRPPVGITHVVLDTPGGMRGFELAKVVSYADAVLMPVCNSLFDRESAAECLAELMTLPRVASGRCRVAAVGMRLDGRTRASEVLGQWAAQLELPFIGVLRDTQAYVRCVEQGLTIFDLPAEKTALDRAQWHPILDWLAPTLHPAPRADAPALKPTRPCTAPVPLRDEPPAPLRPLRPARPVRASKAPAPQRDVPPAAQQVPLGVLEAAPRSRGGAGLTGLVASLFGLLPGRRLRQRGT
jgi:chromosome partitioning protein